MQALGVVAMRGRQRGPLKLGEWRLQFRRPHVGPQNPAALNQRIGLQLDLVAEAAFGRLRRHLDALAGVVVFPAVIRAAQPVVLISPEPQRDAAVGAELVGQRQAALGVAPGQEPLRQKLDSHRRAFVLRQLVGVHRRNPIAAEHLAHRRAGTRLRGIGVLFRSEHGMRLQILSVAQRPPTLQQKRHASHLSRGRKTVSGAWAVNPETIRGRLRMRPCKRLPTKTAGAKRKAIMVEMAKLWGECAEDAERAEKKRIKVSAPNVNANVNA